MSLIYSVIGYTLKYIIIVYEQYYNTIFSVYNLHFKSLYISVFDIFMGFVVVASTIKNLNLFYNMGNFIDGAPYMHVSLLIKYFKINKIIK